MFRGVITTTIITILITIITTTIITILITITTLITPPRDEARKGSGAVNDIRCTNAVRQERYRM